MSDTFLVLEAGATETTQYEVPMVLKPLVEEHIERMRQRRHSLTIWSRQSGKTELTRQWLDAALKADPVAAGLVKVTKTRNRLRGYPATVDVIEEPLDFVRAAGECLCETCGKLYREHPMGGPFTETMGTDPRQWLHRLCDGSLVKL